MVLADGVLVTAVPSFPNLQFTILQLKLDAWNGAILLQGYDFIVTGRSLGGYLAIAIKQFYPQVMEAILSSAPGVNGSLRNLTDILSDV